MLRISTVDQKTVVAIDRRIWSSPGEAGDRSPRLFGRVTFMPDQISSVGQACAMMPRDAMKKNRLSRRVGQEIGGKGHLLGSRP